MKLKLFAFAAQLKRVVSAVVDCVILSNYLYTFSGWDDEYLIRLKDYG